MRVITILVLCLGFAACERKSMQTKVSISVSHGAVFIPKGDTTGVPIPQACESWLKVVYPHILKEGREVTYIGPTPNGTFVLDGKKIYWEGTSVYVDHPTKSKTWLIFDDPNLKSAEEAWLDAVEKDVMTPERSLAVLKYIH